MLIPEKNLLQIVDNKELKDSTVKKQEPFNMSELTHLKKKKTLTHQRSPGSSHHGINCAEV